MRTLEIICAAALLLLSFSFLACGAEGTRNIFFSDSSGNPLREAPQRGTIRLGVVDKVCTEGLLELEAKVTQTRRDAVIKTLIVSLGKTGRGDLFLSFPIELGPGKMFELEERDLLKAAYQPFPQNNETCDSPLTTAIAVEHHVDVFRFVNITYADGEIIFAVGGMGIKDTELSVFNLRGQLVHHSTARGNTTSWDQRRSDGIKLAKGAYLYIIISHESRPTDIWNYGGRKVAIP